MSLKGERSLRYALWEKGQRWEAEGKDGNCFSHVLPSRQQRGSSQRQRRGKCHTPTPVPFLSPGTSQGAALIPTGPKEIPPVPTIWGSPRLQISSQQPREKDHRDKPADKANTAETKDRDESG